MTSCALPGSIDEAPPAHQDKDSTVKTANKPNLIAVALAVALTSTSSFGQGLPTTGVFESPIGPLEVKNGYPTDETVKKLYDALDFQRATQAYI
jgi:hypothetical protein